ncbi:MAG: FHA domain-containing protein [Anaerolineae bacterium]|nr:FHA domain-containing protein [Anaerolineae bacterium]
MLTLQTKQIELATSDIDARATWGTASFQEDAIVLLHVRDAAEPIALRPTANQLTVGRSDNTSPIRPDLDLTPYGAMEKGVSRLHAAIVRNEDTLTLVDLNSSNGTFLNGQLLVPDTPRVLRDGDEIRFGRLVAHLYFQGEPGF